MEFVRSAAADRAGVGEHGAELQSQAGEDAAVGVVHVLVFGGERFVVDVEGVGVLHQELARAHHAEARADLVAELGLDVVEIDRELLVAGQLAAGEVGDDFLGGGSIAVAGLLAVLDLEQLATELLPAPGLLPQFLRLDRRHQQFDRAGGVHFLAHRALDLAQHAQAQRAPRVQAGGELADHAGLEHQLVADDLGLGGGFLAGVEVELRQAHRRGVHAKGSGHFAMRFAGLPASPSWSASTRCGPEALFPGCFGQVGTAVAVDLDAVVRFAVYAYVLAPLRRLRGDLQHAVGIVPAVEHGTGRFGRGGGLVFALGAGLFAFVARVPPPQCGADRDAADEGPAQAHVRAPRPACRSTSAASARSAGPAAYARPWTFPCRACHRRRRPGPRDGRSSIAPGS